MTLRSTLVFCLRCLAIIALVPGCHLIFPFESSDTRYECKTNIVNCDKKPEEPQPVVSKPKPSGKCYAVVPDRRPPGAAQTPWRGLRVGDPAFCDRVWKIDRIEMPELIDSARILTAQADNEVSASKFMELPWVPEAETLYIAYDSRASTPPDWLRNPAEYRKALSDQGVPLHIVVSGGDAVQSVDLEIFERIAPPPSSNPVPLGGNQSGPPTWQGIAPHSSAMYMVIVKPKLELDCSNRTGADILDTVITIGCGGVTEDELKVECEYRRGARALTEQVCWNVLTNDGEPTCTSLGSCPTDEALREVYGKRAYAWTFARSSEIEFDPAVSKADITVAGNKTSMGAKGYVHFEYLLDDFNRLHTFNLNELFLDLGTLNTALGSFADIKVALTLPSVAKCQDANPPWATPCTHYSIPAREILADMSFRHDGKDMVTVAQNANTWPITINHQTRSFKIGPASLKAMLQVNGEDREVLTEINLTGVFKNFEPHAVVAESTPDVECGVNDTSVPSNVKEVHLNSAGSFDVYEPLTGATFDWYEDFGLSSQRSWGKGPLVIIPPYQLSYGTHQMSLVIRDTAGAMNTADFEVAVHDHFPPTLTVPPDRYFLMTQPGGPVHIELGKASGSDSCEPNVGLSNDAPPGSLFSPGLTKVTWTADDGGGNTTTGVQNVYVFQVPSVSEPVLLVEGYADLLEAVAATAEKGLSALQACAPEQGCETGLSELAGYLQQIEDGLAELSPGTVDVERPRALEEVVERLSAVRSRLLEADALLSASTEKAAAAEKQRSAALADAADSGESLREIGRMLRELIDAGEAESRDP